MIGRVLVLAFLVLGTMGAGAEPRHFTATVDTIPPDAVLYNGSGFDARNADLYRLDRLDAHTYKLATDKWLVLIRRPGYQDYQATLDDGHRYTIELQPATFSAFLKVNLVYHPLRTWAVLGPVLLGLIGVGVWLSRRLHPPMRTSSLEASFLGVVIDEYELTERLGEGSFAQVYRGRRPSDGEEVAIKVLKREYFSADDPDIVRRFQREMAIDLLHRNIVHRIGYGEYHHRPYIVMEFLAGQTLRQVMTGKRLTLPEVLDVALQICDGLTFAHDCGIVHRDLKPENIMVLADGRVKLMDFGIAKQLDRTTQTQTHAMMGTPRYMSPEHVSASSTDARSDIYSLGVVLFEMLTGRAPFEADNLLQMISNHLHTPPPKLRELKPDLPETLDEVVLKMLEKDPARRYQSVADARLDLALEAPAP